MGWSIGVDVGGTFTDFYATNTDSGQVVVGKTPSTPANPADAILTGLRALCDDSGIDERAIERLSHGTTVATNTLIQRKGGTVALVTTYGFRDLLEIGRQTRPHMFDLYQDHPPPLVPRAHRLELAERVGPEGEVLIAPTSADIDAVVDAVRASGASACAVGFIFAFRNGAHEQQVRDALQARLPDVAVSISSEVQPEFREYERLSTTVLNAYLQPIMGAYLARLEQAIGERAPDATLGINQSSGGLMSPARARALPVRTALSGPAAGAVGAAHAAKETERRNVITLDMGGTSADVALIRDFQADLTYDRDVAGFPVRLPSVDIETVGAGGGSVAWFDRDGLLKAGPLSAGADPGPACYGRGGEQPTVTDANLLLGRLSARGLLNGQMALDQARARAAFAPLAEKLGFSVERTAHGVLGIVVANMVRTIRTISVERGHDPRTFVLMPFGGAGPLHAHEVAVSLGIDELLIPASPGIVCAQGLVVSDLKEDFVASARTRVDTSGMQALTAAAAQLLEQANAWFASEQADADGQHLELGVDARYVGQNFELSVALASGTTLTADDLPDTAALHARFCAAHETAYGYASADDPIEVVNVRLAARARLGAVPTAGSSTAPDEPPEPIEHRDVHFAPDAPVSTAIYARSSLEAGHRIAGPAIIEQLDTTIPVYPGAIAEITAAGHLIIKLSAAEEGSA
ncbi:MAG: hydantoinase/oxoprolinase family protein [Pseudomonadota bacterium]